MSLLNGNRATPPKPTNKLLAQVEQKVESQLLPGTRDDYLKIVVSGLRVGLKNGPQGIMASLRQSRDPVHDCAVGAVKLVLMLWHQSRGTMPVKAMPPAAMTLMLQALDFADRTGIQKIGVPEIDRATRLFATELFKLWNIDLSKFKGIARKVHDLTQDPTAMEAMARKGGVVKDPRASTPTELPEAAPQEAPNGV